MESASVGRGDRDPTVGETVATGRRDPIVGETARARQAVEAIEVRGRKPAYPEPLGLAGFALTTLC